MTDVVDIVWSDASTPMRVDVVPSAGISLSAALAAPTVVDLASVGAPGLPGRDGLGAPPAGTPKWYRPRPDGTSNTVWKPSVLDVTDYCACDGVTDDSDAFIAMLVQASTLANGATGQCAIYNPGLPVAISKTIYIPKYVNLRGEGGGADVGLGARFVAIGAEAQVVIHERGGKSGPWLCDGNNIADPAAHTVSVTTHSNTTLTVDVLDGVSSPSNAALDALWGKVVTLQGGTIAGDSLFQSVIVATPGKAGYTGATSASGTVTLANATSVSLGSVAGTFGENVWVHILKPSERQLDCFAVTGAVAQVNCRIDKSSNLTWHNPKVTKGRFDGLIIGRNGAAFAFTGQTHLSGNGRTQFQFRDDLGAAALATSRNGKIDHLICETLGALNVRVVEQCSADRLTVDHLSATMNGVIPAFAIGTQYSEIPQFNGVGPANIVDYGGAYYQVLKGAGTFTPTTGQTPDVDTTRWERRADAVALWYFGSEPSAPGTVTNTLTATTGIRTLTSSGDSDSVRRERGVFGSPTT